MPVSGVRAARTVDVDEVAAVNVRSWRQRFPGILPVDALDALDEQDLAMVWASGILNPSTPVDRLLVAVDEDCLVGYAAIGASRDPDADPGTGELLALEVDPARQRQGHGSRLLAAVMDHAQAGGLGTVVAWCALGDEPRRSFLQGAGWGPDGAFRDLLVGADDDLVVREVRLVTALSPSR